MISHKYTAKPAQFKALNTPKWMTKVFRYVKQNKQTPPWTLQLYYKIEKEIPLVSIKKLKTMKSYFSNYSIQLKK